MHSCSGSLCSPKPDRPWQGRCLVADGESMRSSPNDALVHHEGRPYIEVHVPERGGFVRAYRVVPADGRLSPRQKLIYLLMLDEWGRRQQPEWIDYTYGQLMLEIGAGSPNTIKKDI